MSNGETNGPYLTAALLCEKVLQEKDGILSAIRIVDRIIATAQGSQPPEQMPPVPVNITALLMLKSGEARGSYTVKIQPVAPSGFKSPEVSWPIYLEGEDRGANIVLQIVFQAKEEGLYWFEVSFKDELLTRIPLRVVYQRLAIGQTGGTPVH
jgi:Family of unknown function (DUF6941)